MIPATPLGIQQLSLAYLGRPADPASLIAWPATGLSLEAIVPLLVQSSEYQRNTLAIVRASGVETTSLINTLYFRLFGREAVEDEIAGWSSALATGAVNADYLGLTMLNAGLNLSESGPAGEMRSTLLAKLQAADLYSGVLYNSPTLALAYASVQAIEDGVAYLSGVGVSTPATPNGASLAVSAMAARVGVQAPALGVDRITGVWQHDPVTNRNQQAGSFTGGAIVNGRFETNQPLEFEQDSSGIKFKGRLFLDNNNNQQYDAGDYQFGWYWEYERDGEDEERSVLFKVGASGTWSYERGAVELSLFDSRLGSQTHDGPIFITDPSVF